MQKKVQTKMQTRKPLCLSVSLLTITLMATLLSACQVVPVSAWEKGTLADPTMSPSGLAQFGSINSHVYTSKETIKGGEGVAGGGCGCN